LLNATSQWSTTVPEPTPPNVMPLISLSAPTIAPPCHTRTYCSVPELSVGLEPPYVLPAMPSMTLGVAAEVGALPRRMRPPHLPRAPRAIEPDVDAVSVVATLLSASADSVRIVVMVIGEELMPVAEIEAPLSMTIAGAAEAPSPSGS
jgi:hypothetical protein